MIKRYFLQLQRGWFCCIFLDHNCIYFSVLLFYHSLLRSKVVCSRNLERATYSKCPTVVRHLFGFQNSYIEYIISSISKRKKSRTIDIFVVVVASYVTLSVCTVFTHTQDVALICLFSRPVNDCVATEAFCILCLAKIFIPHGDFPIFLYYDLLLKKDALLDFMRRTFTK